MRSKTESAKAAAFREAAEAIIVEGRIRHVVFVDRPIRGLAVWKPRTGPQYMVTSEPTSFERLTTVAHEVGHLFLQHGNSLPRYREEFEAERYAYAALRRVGMPINETAAELRMRSVSAQCIIKVRNSIKRLCRECFQQGERPLRYSARGRLLVQKIEEGEVDLVDLKAADPGRCPLPRTRPHEVTYYHVGKDWHGRKSSLTGRKGITKKYPTDWHPDESKLSTLKGGRELWSKRQLLGYASWLRLGLRHYAFDDIGSLSNIGEHSFDDVVNFLNGTQKLSPDFLRQFDAACQELINDNNPKADRWVSTYQALSSKVAIRQIH